MSRIDAEMLQSFVRLAAERLKGDWVVIGGCVLPLLGVEHRTTVDIDVAGPRDADADQVFILMEIAEELGLPVEAINQAGAFFLRRIEGWPDHVVVVRRVPPRPGDRVARAPAAARGAPLAPRLRPVVG